MARLLIVGGGCRGRELARAVQRHGHAVRITTRSPECLREIEAIGAEAHLGDPGRIATITQALDHATILLWLLGTASGLEGEVAALHGPRLERLLEEVIDTTVRGVVYEAAGTVGQAELARGRRALEHAHRESAIPFALLEADPTDRPTWVQAAIQKVERLLL